MALKRKHRRVITKATIEEIIQLINEVQQKVDEGVIQLPPDEWTTLSTILEEARQLLERDDVTLLYLKNAIWFVIDTFEQNDPLANYFAERTIALKEIIKYSYIINQINSNSVIQHMLEVDDILQKASRNTQQQQNENSTNDDKHQPSTHADSDAQEQSDVVPSESEEGDLPQTEAFAVARLEDVEDDEPLLLGTEYKLLAGVSHEKPSGFKVQKFQLPTASEEVEMDVVVHAPGFDISPKWSQRVNVIQGQGSELLPFMLVPKEAGEKKIEVKFYYENHWLTTIEFKVIVITPESLEKLMSKQKRRRQKPKKVSRISPLAYRTYPNDISLDISRNGSRYDLYIRTEGQKLAPVTINTSRDEWALLSGDLQKEMAKAVREICKSTEPLRNDEIATLFRPLAEIGHLVFNRIFVGEDVARLINQQAPQTIEIGSTEFFLPWECLYPKNIKEPLDVSSFWGMRYIISRQITRSKPADVVNPEIKTTKAPTIGLLSYHKLRGVKEKEVPFFDKLDQQKKITLLKLRALDPKNKHTELDEFEAFWLRPLHLAHLACHACYDQERVLSSFIRLSNEFPISLQDMENYVKKINGHPLLVLNACEMGNMNPRYSSHFASLFLKYGVRGVVATECAVPDTFAADFIEQFYTHLLTGTPLGESLLRTRQHFWEQERNPSGLLYAMYAPPSIRLAYE